MKNGQRQICDDVIKLINRSKIAAIALAEEQGMTQMQLFVLYCLQGRGQLAMGQLADAMHCDASNVTGLVDRLVAQKMIVRQESPQDRRAKTLHLTKKGEEMIEAIMAALPARLGCNKLTAAEQRALHAIVQKITA